MDFFSSIGILKNILHILLKLIDRHWVVFRIQAMHFSSHLSLVCQECLSPSETNFFFKPQTFLLIICLHFQVLGGFDSANYVTERQWATAADGTHIPISIVYRKDLVKLDGSDPFLLYGYGSYEVMHHFID